MREARLRMAAEWRPQDLAGLDTLISDGRLSLDGLLTHSRAPAQFDQAYATAFTDPDCLKMVVDWRQAA
jgi:3-hydroxyethyl bacteriochlorophyllide a dehydrogenase